MAPGLGRHGGRYLFLTDDRGVGCAHGELAIACYRVTRLRDLLAWVLANGTSGPAAKAEEVIREVGS